MGKEALPEEEAGVDPDGEGSTVAARLQGVPWEVTWGPWRWWGAAETLEWSWGESQQSWWAGRMMGFNLPFPWKDQRKGGASEDLSVSDGALRFSEALRPGLGQGRPSLVTGPFLLAPRGRERLPGKH